MVTADDRPTWFAPLENAVDETLTRERQRVASLSAAARPWMGPILFFAEHGLPAFPEAALECATDSFEGLSLAVHAYYKSAVAALRRQLELALASCFFLRLAPTKHGVRQRERYLRGGGAPRWRELKEVLDSELFKDYATAMRDSGRGDLASDVEKSEIDRLFGVISKAPHGAFGTWNFSDWQFEPFPRYSPDAFEAWADLFEAVQRVTLLWILLGHPGMFAWIDAQHPARWEEVFDSTQVDYLRHRPNTRSR